MMVFTRFGKFQEAGVAMSFSLVIVLAAALTLTPALLRLAGHWAFWPPPVVVAGLGGVPADFTLQLDCGIIGAGVVRPLLGLDRSGLAGKARPDLDRFYPADGAPSPSWPFGGRTNSATACSPNCRRPTPAWWARRPCEHIFLRDSLVR